MLEVPAAVDHDLIIIGAGAGGLGAARAARWAGADVLLINDGPLGGDCLFTGCVPSKTLLASGRDGLDFRAAMSRVASTIERIGATETPQVLTEEGVAVLDGRARLATRDTVEVGEKRITARRIIVATGARPLLPPIPGLDQVPALTNLTVWDLDTKPASLGIIGGGPLGCELAQAFAALGVRVSVFEADERLLPSEEPGASAVVASVLSADGVEVNVGAAVQRVERTAEGIVLSSGRELHTVEKLLVAVGRVPNSEGLGLEELGVRVGEGGNIVTDERLRTSVRGIYAVGDVTGRLQFTHAADEMGRLAVANALGKGHRGRFRTHWVPMVTFTTPEVARIGLTEAQAAAHGGRVAELPLSEMDRAITDGATDGYIKLIAGPKPITRRMFGGRLIGATIVAPRAGEMIHEVALAMRTSMFTGRLAQTSHAYPTWSYGVQKAAAQFFGDVEGREARSALR